MKFCDINPFMRYAMLQPSVETKVPISCSYDHRLFYVVEGATTLILSNKKIPVTSGTLVYIPSATPYCFEGRTRIISINFDLTRNYASKRKPINKSKSSKSFDDSRVLETDLPKQLKNAVILQNAIEIEAKLEKCLVCHAYPSEVTDAQSSAIIKDVLCYIVQNENKSKEDLPKIVQKITLYIRQNYDKEITNSQIGELLGYHSFYLNRVFKNSTGITIHQALIKERIRIAKRLLVETELPISTVASESGFCTQAQFSAAFRKYTGYTPNEYRKK